MKIIRNILFVVALVMLSSTAARAQWVQETRKQLDTLSIADRLSIRTNGVDWLMLIPNVGMEFDVANNKNWNRWTVGANLRYKWGTKNTYAPGFVFNIFEAKLEGKNYWRTRKTDNDAVAPHKHIWDKFASQRRKDPKHPVTTFYRGVYISYATYSVRLQSNKTGYQGKAIQAGIIYGIQRPLYRYSNGRSIDLDLSVSGGVAMTKYDRYTRNAIDNVYVKRGEQPQWTFLKMPVLNELRAGLVYRLGKTAGYKKYNFRYDVDVNYRAKVTEVLLDKRLTADKKFKADSTFNAIYSYYQHQLDSIVKANPEEAKSDERKAREAQDAIDRKLKTEKQQKEKAKKDAENAKKAAATADKKAAEAEKKAVQEANKKAAEAEKKAAQEAAKLKEKEEKENAKKEKASKKKEAKDEKK